MSDSSHSHGPEVIHGGAAHSGHDAHGHDDHGGLTKYIYVFIALCVLTGASFFTYSSLWPFHKTPQVGWTFMMAVSCTKAMLVILFFMHVKYEANWKYVLTIPAGFMSIFLMLMLVPDVGMRTRMYSGDRWYYAPRPETEAQRIKGEFKEAKEEGKKKEAPKGH